MLGWTAPGGIAPGSSAGQAVADRFAGTQAEETRGRGASPTRRFPLRASVIAAKTARSGARTLLPSHGLNQHGVALLGEEAAGGRRVAAMYSPIESAKLR